MIFHNYRKYSRLGFHRPRVGNLLPSKSHLNPFTTARRPMRATIILRSIDHKYFPKKKGLYQLEALIGVSFLTHLLQRTAKEPQMGGKRATCGSGAAGCRPLSQTKNFLTLALTFSILFQLLDRIISDFAITTAVLSQQLNCFFKFAWRSDSAIEQKFY